MFQQLCRRLPSLRTWQSSALKMATFAAKPANARPAFFHLSNNLALGYSCNMSKANDAARELARRSVEARRKKWGKKEFARRMREWGKLGGRPRKTGKTQRERER
jgi:hypothetical protein